MARCDTRRFVEYCFAPKHTIGEQLLDVRKNKRERAAFAVAEEASDKEDERNEDSTDLDGQYRVEIVEPDPDSDPGEYDA